MQTILTLCLIAAIVTLITFLNLDDRRHPSSPEDEAQIEKDSRDFQL